MICGQSTLVGEDQQTVKLVRLRCRSWTCSYCAQRRKKRLIKEAVRGSPNRFITLTVNVHRYDTPDEAAQALSIAWRRAREALKRYHGFKDLEAIMVFERTRAGWPHLHILARCAFISQKWLSGFMRNRMDSPIVDVRKIKGARMAAGYVAKYIGKDPHRFDGTKRYWRTRHYLPPKADRAPTTRLWRVSMACFDVWAKRLAGEAHIDAIREAENMVFAKPP